MIIDASALVAILRKEREQVPFLRAIESASSVRLSAASFVETAVVIDGGRDPVLSRRLDELLRAGRVLIEPVTESQAHLARQAYKDYGKGSGHPARLNFGDCFAYALAVEKGEPLLFKGSDFSETDVEPYAPED